MVKNRVANVLAVSFYLSLLFVIIGFIFTWVNGSSNEVVIENANLSQVWQAFLAGKGIGAFFIAAFVVCASPFLTGVVLIFYGIKYKNYQPAIIACALIILLIASISI